MRGVYDEAWGVVTSTCRCWWWWWGRRRSAFVVVHRDMTMDGTSSKMTALSDEHFELVQRLHAWAQRRAETKSLVNHEYAKTLGTCCFSYACLPSYGRSFDVEEQGTFPLPRKRKGLTVYSASPASTSATPRMLASTCGMALAPPAIRQRIQCHHPATTYQSACTAAPVVLAVCVVCECDTRDRVFGCSPTTGKGVVVMAKVTEAVLPRMRQLVQAAAVQPGTWLLVRNLIAWSSVAATCVGHPPAFRATVLHSSSGLTQPCLLPQRRTEHVPYCGG